MTYDAALRTAALVAAVALLAAPYWPGIARRLAEAARASGISRADAARFAAAGLLIVAAFGTGLAPAVRSFDWSLANIITAMKVGVGLTFVATAFVEAARWSQARMRPTL